MRIPESVKSFIAKTPEWTTTANIFAAGAIISALAAQILNSKVRCSDHKVEICDPCKETGKPRAAMLDCGSCLPKLKAAENCNNCRETNRNRAQWHNRSFDSFCLFIVCYASMNVYGAIKFGLGKWAFCKKG